MAGPGLFTVPGLGERSHGFLNAKDKSFKINLTLSLYIESRVRVAHYTTLVHTDTQMYITQQ